MRRAVVLLLGALVVSPLAVEACNVTELQPPSNEICQPSQLVRCNDCPKPDPNDPRVWRGWIQCSADGSSFVGTCGQCAPDDTGSPPLGGSSSSGGSESSSGFGSSTGGGAPGGGDDASGGDDVDDASSSSGGEQNMESSAEPTTLNVTGALDGVGQVQVVPSADGTTNSSTLTVSASSVSYDQLPAEAPDVEAAASVAVTPPLGACNGSLSFQLSLTSASVTFTGSDLVPAQDCADYAANLAQNGMTAVFQNAPYPGGGTASQLTLTLSPR